MSISVKPYLQRIALNPAAEDNPRDKYPFTIPAVAMLDQIAFHQDVTFFVGENGAGKSTVLEAIAVALGYSAEGGTKNVRLQTTETSSVSPLHDMLQLVRSYKKPEDGFFLRAESFFNIATYMDATGYTRGYGGSLHTRSHGEAFMALLTYKFEGHGLYLLDEPEAALSPNRQLAALCAINDLVNKESQFIIATHSPILLSYPNAKIIQFDEHGLSEIAYEDTEHYRITRDFLNHYPRRLEQLFADETTADD
jgi:predicted ATPase